MTEILLPIDGMTCAACSRGVERALNKLDGVEEVNVSIATNHARVVFDENKLRIADIKLAVAKAGFTPLNIEKKHDAEAERSRAKKRTDEIKRKFIIAVIFAVPLVYLAMGHMFGAPIPSFLSPDEHMLNFALAQLILTLPILYAGRSFFAVGVKSALHKSPNMDTLVATGATAAFLYSIYSVVRIASGVQVNAHELYFESIGMIITFVLLGRMLESRSKSKTSEAVYRLMELAPKTAVLEKDSVEVTISADEIAKDDIIIVKPGSVIAVDGIVTSGYTSVDESMLTGESIPVEKQIGDTVYSGTLNKNGSVKVKATGDSENTTLSRIIRLMEEAQNTKAPIARLADIISGWFVPIVVSIALISSLIWLIAGEGASFALTVFVSVLVVACPCALGLATPTAIMAGTGKGAENGILIKSGQSLETAHKLNAVVFDKTGTITQGNPQVTDVVTLNGASDDEVIYYGASAEKGSEHPLGEAILNYANNKNISVRSPESFEAIPGKGLEAVVDGNKILFGNPRLMEENGCNINDAISDVEKLSSEGKTPVCLSVNGILKGIIAIADPVREESAEVVKELQNLGLDVIMLTGDNEKTAEAIAKKVGIDHVYASVLPDGKAEVVSKLRNDGKIVAMVGDGINDAPALVSADVGIAVSSGTDIAMDSADIVLMRDDLHLISQSIKLSRKTIRVIKQNLFWAFAYNTLGIPIAAGLLYLFGGGLLNPMFAAAAMSISSVCVVTNSLRLRRFSL